MVMSYIWTMILGISIFFATLSGNMGRLAAAVPQGAQAGVSLAISLAGSICLWSGVGALMTAVGATAMLSRIFSPLLGRLFPGTKTDPILAGHLSANFCANLLGLGNAATPMGILAAKRLTDPQHPDRASDSLCRLVVLNTASIQLIPANVAAVRSGLGCSTPFDILPCVWVTSLCSVSVGMFAAWVLGKVWPHD
jgi:spore maturation protein A